MPDFTFHLIATAHIDPVWLWDWREGFNEGLTTCRAILNLMDEYPHLTFTRGEAAIYEHIEKTDRETFARIRKYVEAGRWEVVGGTFIQSDENLPDTESLIRQYLRGQQYFTSRFGKPVEVAWSADCFGHSAGLPAILNAAGLKQFCFTRPLIDECPLPGPAFHWNGPGHSSALTYRPYCDWYCIERDGMIPRLNQTLATAPTGSLHNVAVMYGIGNHGGGPTRKHLAEIQQWAEQHPAVKIVYSTLHRLFASIHDELNAPTPAKIGAYRGDINYCERGCHASMAKLKFLHRTAQSMVTRAETTDAILAAKLQRPPAALHDAWDSVLFNSFHDILPGTSIERASNGQIHHLGAAIHAAEVVEFRALNALAHEVDTTVLPADGPDLPTGVPFLVWNPHPAEFVGHVELEASLDYRPLWKYVNRPGQVPVRVLDADRNPLPFQLIDTESHSHPQVPWRKRALIPLTLPPMGWTVIEMGYSENAPPPYWPAPKQPVAFYSGEAIENGIFKVDTYIGARGIRIRRNNVPVFALDGLAVATFDDPWGSWGGPENDPQCHHQNTLKEQWLVTDVRILETGPVRASLWVRFAGRDGTSRLDLTLRLNAGEDRVDIAARAHWDERLARLKILLPAGERAEFDSPGGSVTRSPAGQMPGGRWVRILNPNGPSVGLVSDALSSFDLANGSLHATVVRSSRYAYGVKIIEDQPWLPASDNGELTFHMLLVPGDQDLQRLARVLAQPPLALPVPATPGPLGRRASLFQVTPSTLHCLALKPAFSGAGYILRLQNASTDSAQPHVTILGTPLTLDAMLPGAIASWRLDFAAGAWTARPSIATELEP